MRGRAGKGSSVREVRGSNECVSATSERARRTHLFFPKLNIGSVDASVLLFVFARTAL